MGGGGVGGEATHPLTHTDTQCLVIAESPYWGSVGKHEGESSILLKTPAQTASLLISSLEIPPLLLLPLDLLIRTWNKVAQVLAVPSRA